MSTHTLETTITVNGRVVTRLIEPRQHLVDFLRDTLDLTGTHLGCEHGACGACTVQVDGLTVRGCLKLAVACNGKTVNSIEGLTDSGELAVLQKAFHERNALQCGFCTPGMLITALDVVREQAKTDTALSREQIREAISGNYCRCTGYQSIVDAIDDVLVAQRGGAQALSGAATSTAPAAGAKA
jgi:aerobic-type carbon monoxide dehydrogenase small subunit (CoxS/CutS family)